MAYSWKNSVFKTALQAEDAFYSAFNDHDIDAMMSVWDAAGDIVCVHPGGIRLEQWKAIEESWTAIFSAEGSVNLYTDAVIHFASETLNVHHVKEHISVGGTFHGTVLAVNVYRKTDSGWKMISHHASGEPPSPSSRTDLH